MIILLISLSVTVLLGGGVVVLDPGHSLRHRLPRHSVLQGLQQTVQTHIISWLHHHHQVSSDVTQQQGDNKYIKIWVSGQSWEFNLDQTKTMDCNILMLRNMLCTATGWVHINPFKFPVLPIQSSHPHNDHNTIYTRNITLWSQSEQVWDADHWSPMCAITSTVTPGLVPAVGHSSTLQWSRYEQLQQWEVVLLSQDTPSSVLCVWITSPTLTSLTMRERITKIVFPMF